MGEYAFRAMKCTGDFLSVCVNALESPVRFGRYPTNRGKGVKGNYLILTKKKWPYTKLLNTIDESDYMD
jgi:hypothetical protein